MILYDAFKIEPEEKGKFQKFIELGKDYAKKGLLSGLVAILAFTPMVRAIFPQKKQIKVPDAITATEMRKNELAEKAEKEYQALCEYIPKDFVDNFKDKANASEIKMLWNGLEENLKNMNSESKENFNEFYPEYVNSILNIKNSKGKQIFRTESLFSKKADGNISHGFLDLQGSELFIRYHLIKNLEKNPIKTGDGQIGMLLSEDFNAKTFLEKNLKEFKEYASELGDITGMKGEPIFDGIESLGYFNVKQLHDYGLTNSYIQGVESKYVTLDNLKKIFAPFKDTEKPNAVVVIAKKDWNRVFRTPYMIKEFHDKISKACDTYFVVANDETDFYETKEKVPEKVFTGILGHGDGKLIALGCDDPRFNVSIDEKANLDRSDNEIADYFRPYEKNGKKIESVTKDGVILLLSCASAKGTENIYEFFTQKTDGRCVIGAEKLINLMDFKFDIGENGKIDANKIKFLDIFGDYAKRSKIK